MIKRILVALGGTRHTEAAIEYAISLAHRHGAEIAGITDIDVTHLDDTGPLAAGESATQLELRRRDVDEQLARAVKRFETACRGESIPYTVYRETGQPFEHLIDLWRYYDLTIVGLQGLFSYELLPKPDDAIIRLIHSGVRPILAVGPEHRRIERVLIAYNGSMESAKTMKRFVQMHLWPNLKLHLMCFELDPEHAGRLLADAAAYCRAHGYRPETEYVPHPPRERLLERAAQLDADLVVMGSTARARIVRKLLGDTALHAIRNAETPLFMAQ
jgi:nucleotide-binding universal stress UspA family protein